MTSSFTVHAQRVGGWTADLDPDGFTADDLPALACAVAATSRAKGASELPNVTVQVLPFTAGAHAGINGSFHVLEFPDPDDPRVVYVDNLTSSLYLERSREVGRFRLAFEQLQATSLGPTESASMIATMAKEV